MVLSVRPSRTLAISAHLLLCFLCIKNKIHSSSLDQLIFLIRGFKWLCQRSLHCLPIRPVKCSAIVVHLCGPCYSTSYSTRQSSSSVHGPFIKVTLWFFPEVFYKFINTKLLRYLKVLFQLWVLDIFRAYFVTFITFFWFSEHSIDIFELPVQLLWSIGSLSTRLGTLLHAGKQGERTWISVVGFGCVSLDQWGCQAKISLIVVPWVYASIGSSADNSLRRNRVAWVSMSILLASRVCDFSLQCLRWT